MSDREMQESFDGNTTVETTVGDLIEALTSVAEEAGRTEQECYKIASFAIERILREKRQRELLS